MSAEEWRPVAGYGEYLIGSHGTVISLKSGQPRRLVGGTASAMGYRIVTLRDERGKHSVLVHRLVAEHFLGPCPPGFEVRHLNGDHLDNRVDNLAFGTHRENMRDRVLHGTDPNASKTHCKREHPLDEVNTYRRGRKRHCRACRSAASRKYRERRAFRAAGVPA